MKKTFGLLLLGISVIFSCTTDFEVTDDWKEIGVVYCLLDQTDSVQYVRLQRAYLNENADAYQLAQVSDSIYYTQEVLVQLIRNKDTTNLIPVKIENKEKGDFSSEPYFAYKTPKGFKVIGRQDYTLRVKNTETGYELKSTTKAIAMGTVDDPASAITSLAYCNSNKEFINYVTRSMSILSGKWVKFYDLSIELHYAEIDSNNISDTVPKSISWQLGKLVSVANLNGNLPAQIKYSGKEFMSFLGNNLEPKPGFARVVDHLEFVFLAGGQDIYDYINVNRPSTGIVQKKPEFTNIENGLGIFSSRTTQRVKVELDDCSIDRIATDERTSQLGFVR